MRYLTGGFYQQIALYLDLKEMPFNMIIFKVYLSTIGLDESDKLWWKLEMFLFQQRKKGRYICHSMSASQSKSGENT